MRKRKYKGNRINRRRLKEIETEEREIERDTRVAMGTRYNIDLGNRMNGFLLKRI